MARRIRLLALSLVGIALFLLGANSTPSQAIAVLDIEAAMVNTRLGKQLSAEFSKKRSAADAQLQGLWDRYAELANDLMKKRFALSPEATREREIELAQLENDLVNERRRLQGQLQIERERLFGPERARILRSAQEMGRKYRLSLIVVKGTPGLVYTPETFDITEEVIEQADRG